MNYASSTLRLAILSGAFFFAGCGASQDTADTDAAAQPVVEAPEAPSSEELREAASQQLDNETTLRAIASSPHRSDANRLRNDWRHPVETLLFFGLEPDMSVIELGPGRGWYTEVIAPFVVNEGSYLAALDAPDGERAHYRNGWFEFTASNEALYGTLEDTVLAPPQYQMAEADSVDMVLSFRHAHGWVTNGLMDGNLAEILRVLKPGGVFGVVAHRAPEGSDVNETAANGYLPQAWLIETIEAAGFELVATSEVNANPRDTADHQYGVWSIAPTLRGTDEEKEANAKIGESDRMTLKFRKPL